MIYETYAVGKGTAIEPIYKEITDRLQNIIWNLTYNGKDVSAKDQVFTGSIPGLSSSEISVLKR